MDRTDDGQECQVIDDPSVRRYLDFFKRQYRGDPGYSCTAEFTLSSVLQGSTKFVRSCWVRPLLVESNGQVVAQCILIHDPALDVLQLGFFEALPDQQAAVTVLLDQARQAAATRNLKTVVIGMNGHLSMGVGILVSGFTPISFGSNWNKPYYAQYFKNLQSIRLGAFRGPISEVLAEAGRRDALPQPCPGVPTGVPTGVTVRCADLKCWDQEMETFRILCDATLGTTNLYAPTQPGHFAELLGDLRPFLKPENLLFVMAGQQAVGFWFWHPDYNQVLPFGRSAGVAEIALRYFLRGSRIRTGISNAIGVLPNYRGVATTALMRRMAQIVGGRFDSFETTFIWGNNDASNMFAKRSGAKPWREYAVWIDEVPL